MTSEPTTPPKRPVTEIQRFYDDGHDLGECVARFGFSRASWSQAVKRGEIHARPRAASIERYLVAGRRTSRTHLKARLLASGLKAAGARCAASSAGVAFHSRSSCTTTTA